MKIKIFNKKEVRNKIIKVMESQGFKVNPNLKLENNEKETLKKVHELKTKEQIKHHKKALLRYFDKVMEFSISGKDLEPDKIDIKLKEVKSNSLEYQLFFWWNLIWWSIPYTKAIGRQMRFLLWDEYHNAPFGLFLLQSPTLRSGVRDKYLGLRKENVDYWINQSMYGQRIGALPPYNDLLGGKMIVLSLVSNEVRKIYEKKYLNRKTELSNRILPNRLLFTTTTGAFGKSSVYDRIKYKEQIVSKFIGYTKGSGTFHLPNNLYLECLKFLEQNGIDTKRGYGTGPSRKLKLISKAFSFLDLPKFQYHNIRRGIYLFANAGNLNEVIHERKEPVYYNRPFKELEMFWLKRYCIPRIKRLNRWREFNSKDYFQKVYQFIEKI